jgi:hypothetical protein
MKIGAVCHPRVSLTSTHFFGWTLWSKARDSALSLGERVASVASRARGYLVILDPVIPPCRASDPSPGPRRLVKAPVAVHPLPLGEGKDPIPSLSPRRGVRQSTEDGETRCSADLRFAGPRFAKSRRSRKRRSAPPSGWKGRRSQTFLSAPLKHPSFCFPPSAFCLLLTAYLAPNSSATLGGGT